MCFVHALGSLSLSLYSFYSFWYLQLCLFYFCLSGATILTVINNGIFLLVFALFVCIVSCFSRSGWVHVFHLSVLYVF